MSANFYTLLTALGAAAVVNAQAAGNTVPITHLAIGDGAGAAVIPTEAMTTLKREVHRVPITSITGDPDNPSWLVVEAVVPTEVGGWTIREIGLIGGAPARLLAVGNFPDTYKPLLAEGSGRDLRVRMILQVGNASVVQLTVDPSVVVATNQAIVNAIRDHEAKADPHPQYAKGTALTVHIQAADPHPQYSKTSDLAAHLLAADPHPQYVTDAELAAQLASALATLSDPARNYFMSQH